MIFRKNIGTQCYEDNGEAHIEHSYERTWLGRLLRMDNKKIVWSSVLDKSNLDKYTIWIGRKFYHDPKTNEQTRRSLITIAYEGSNLYFALCAEHAIGSIIKELETI